VTTVSFFSVQNLPLLNALLNSLATIFLFCGWLAIKRGKKETHRKLMISAFLTSAVFLTSYLFYHFTVKAVTVYPGEGVFKWIYYGILSTHIPAAILIVPFIFYALYLAKIGNFAKHKKVTRWLWPVWMYVSVTGVTIYLMLYVFVG